MHSVSERKIYNQMQGKSEFEVTGNLKDWERWDRLHEIKVKALTIGSNYDEMDPADMRKMATLMPNATPPSAPTAATWPSGTIRPSISGTCSLSWAAYRVPAGPVGKSFDTDAGALSIRSAPE